MIELLSGPLIGDHTSRSSREFDRGFKAAPCHGELIIAFDPALLGNGNEKYGAEQLLNGISDQGVRLAGERRHEHRLRNLQEGIPVNASLYKRIKSLMAD